MICPGVIRIDIADKTCMHAFCFPTLQPPRSSHSSSSLRRSRSAGWGQTHNPPVLPHDNRSCSMHALILPSAYLLACLPSIPPFFLGHMKENIVVLCMKTLHRGGGGGLSYVPSPIHFPYLPILHPPRPLFPNFAGVVSPSVRPSVRSCRLHPYESLDLFRRKNKTGGSQVLWGLYE